MCSNNDIIGTLTISSYVGQCYFQVTSNLNKSEQEKFFKQRYYRNINTLILCRPVLLSGNDQSEHVTAVERFQRTMLLEL